MSKYLQQLKNVCRYVKKKRENGRKKKISPSQLLKEYQMEVVQEHNNSNYSCGRGCSATFMNLNKEHLFRNDRKLPDALCMAS